MVQGNRSGQASRPKLVVHNATLPSGLVTGPLGPNARIVGPKGTTVYLAERAVIVADTVPGDLAAFLRRYHGTDLGPTAIGDPASGQSVYHTVRLDPAGFNDTSFASLLAANRVTKGTFTFSSSRAEKLLALVLTNQLAGLSVWPETLHLDQSAPTTDESLDGGSSTKSYSNDTWANPQGDGRLRGRPPRAGSRRCSTS